MAQPAKRHGVRVARGHESRANAKSMIYEIMYIIPSKYSDTEIEGITQTINGLFEKHEAKVEKTQNLGKLKFAYTIKGVTHGTYILTFIEVGGAAIAKIDQELRLADQVLRHIIVKREKGIPTHDIKLAQYQEPINSLGKRTAKHVAAEVIDKPVAQDAPEISVDTINEKLDEMLEDDTLEA